MSIVRTTSFRFAAVTALVTAALASSARAQDHSRVPVDSARTELDRVTRDAPTLHIEIDSVVRGNRFIAANEVVKGDVAVFRGRLDVAGSIEGNAVALGGTVLLRRGAHVKGDVITFGGHIVNQGATVDGETRVIGGMLGSNWIPQSPFARVHGPGGRAALVGAWFAILAVIGGLVSLLARSNLEQIADRVQDDFSKSFVFGLLGQLAILPGMIAAIIALTLTIIGIIVIPIAVVAIILGAAGALALGFVTVAFITGNTMIGRRGSGSVVAQTLYCLIAGLVIYGALWMIAAVPQWGGFLGGAIRLSAVIVTWVAVTVGFGATILTRGGTRGSFTSAIPLPATRAEDDYAWQTPTPVTGVAAARRPTPPPGNRVE